MVEIRQTEAYSQWFNNLRDRQARARIDVRIRRLSLGNLGDVKPVGEGVSELRIDYGPGYRVYFVQRGQRLVILLAGGDKNTQHHDIQTAPGTGPEALGDCHGKNSNSTLGPSGTSGNR